MADAAVLAATLRALHHSDEPLVLANVWDAGTARIVEQAGFPAVATSSAAVAEARGSADHEAMPADTAFAAVAEITRAVAIPVTADMESGYGLAPADFVARLLQAGAVGCNFEDSDHAQPGQLRDADEQAQRIAALRAAGDIVVNARVDTFLLQIGSPAEQLAEGIRRARLYLDAGADCVYPIGLADEDVVAEFVQAVAAPVNILARPGAPSLDRLRGLGVRRISVGSGFYRQAMKAFTEAVTAYRDDARQTGSNS